jgi:hypothetical protein
MIFFCLLVISQLLLQVKQLFTALNLEIGVLEVDTRGEQTTVNLSLTLVVL